MANTITHSNCIICKSDNISFLHKCIDYTATKETFEVWQCNNCSHGFTQNIPAQAEIGKYYDSADYISHSDTKKGLVNKLYHSARDYMLNSKRKLVKKFTSNKNVSVLDIGSGTGYFLNNLKQHNIKAQGLEVDEKSRNASIEKFGINVATLDQLFAFEAESFDAVTMWHVMEHVETLNEYVVQIKKILNTKGKAFIAVPNHVSFDGKYYKEFWAGYDVPRHLWHFTPKSMELLFKNHGLRLVKKKHMPFDPFYISLLSQKYKGGILQFVKGMTIGKLAFFNGFFNVDKASSVIYIFEKED